jgi:sec-independent protein translocase protein TatA
MAGLGKEVSMPNPVLGEIIGPDILIVLVVILVLFGGSQLPKLAKGLGSAQREFKKGLEEGDADKAEKPDSTKSD